MNFTDMVVVITGGSKGFGKGLAKAFVDKGAKVVVASNDEALLSEAANELGADSRTCDVTSYEEVHALADFAISKYGRIDVWINNAGIQIAPSNVEDVDIEKLHELFDINFFGYFYGCKAVVPIMRKHIQKVMDNFEAPQPELDVIIPRPSK